MIPADWIDFMNADGVVTLKLPPDWFADDEDEEDDTTAFAPEDDEAAGILRLSCAVYERDEDVTDRALPKLLVKRGPQPKRLTDTRYAFHTFEEDEEEGEPIYTHTWQMIQQTAPREVVVVIATYTLGENETPAQAEPFVNALEASITTAVISTEDAEEE